MVQNIILLLIKKIKDKRIIMSNKTKVPIEELINLYNKGFSCEDIGYIIGRSRQAVWERLKRKGFKLRTKKVLPYIIYDGLKFTPNDHGYYRATTRDKHISLHRYKYEKEVGIIPDGFDIHHIDGNKQNNNISNLECLSKSEHTKKYSPHHNQFKNYKTIESGDWKNE